jgi:hypothetical protein
MESPPHHFFLFEDPPTFLLTRAHVVRQTGDTSFLGLRIIAGRNDKKYYTLKGIYFVKVNQKFDNHYEKQYAFIMEIIIKEKMKKRVTSLNKEWFDSLSQQEQSSIMALRSFAPAWDDKHGDIYKDYVDRYFSQKR